jgi:hypothetical protein
MHDQMHHQSYKTINYLEERSTMQMNIETDLHNVAAAAAKGHDNVLAFSRGFYILLERFLKHMLPAHIY